MLKGYWAQWESLTLENGLLKRAWESADGRDVVIQLIVPQSKVQSVLKEMHDGLSGGHLGINKNLEKIRKRFYYLHLCHDVEECEICAASKGPQTRSRGKMRQYIVGPPFERISIDIAGPFPVTDDGNRYTMVICDYITKWVEAYTIPNQEVTTVAKALVHSFCCHYGVPMEIQMDQGKNFELGVFKELCRLLEFQKTRTTPLHPQSDGMVERFNSTLEQHLSKVVDENQTDWDQRIPL